MPEAMLVFGQFYFLAGRFYTSMLRLLIPAISLLLLVSCNGHTTKVETDPDVGYKTTFRINRKTHLHDGPYTKRDANGLLLETGTLLNGVQSGIRELYYPDGKVKVRERYVNGQMDDLYQYYHPNGAIQLKGYYVGGEM
ncbi:MAG TPA: hypothetical protein VJ508_03000, partial [Saprospiraceae bacterium]|nr:hypothetical protein [Saprospiraceae bacterium]